MNKYFYLSNKSSQVIPDDISKAKLYKTFINGLVLQNAVWNESLRKLDKCDLEKSHEMSMVN